MVDPNGGNLRPTELLRRQDAAVPGDHLEVGVDQDRHVESEGLDAARDLAGLLRGVPPRVGGIEFQCRDRLINDRDISWRAFPGTSVSSM